MQEANFSIRTMTGGTLHLSQAVLIYESGGDNAFATVHSVEEVDGQPVILAGQAMTPSAASLLCRALSKNTTHGGFMPETVLYTDGDLLVWWVPPAERHIVFRAPELKERWGVEERGERVPHPGLVFAVSGSIWKVWAVKGKQRPTLETSIFHAPYFNVGDDGGICGGNVTLPQGTTADKIAAWNAAFLDSAFTHPNGMHRVVKYCGGVYAFWLDMLNGKFERFPQRVLNDTGTTVGKLLGLVVDKEKKE